MKSEVKSDGNLQDIQTHIIDREKQERQAAAILTTETLQALNVSIDALPQRCQQSLQKLAQIQTELGVAKLDPIIISQAQSKHTAEKLQVEYELLEVKHENVKLDKQIERNKKILEDLRKQLKASKEGLSSQGLTPDNVQEHLRQTRQKLASYEEIYEKAKSKYNKLNIPDHILPAQLSELAQRLAERRAEADALRLRASDVTLARRARDTLSQLASNYEQ